MEQSDLDRDSLKIGDYVVLKDVNLGCFLSVEGILLDDVVGEDRLPSIYDSLFCVHQQRQYSAARELNAFLEQYSMDVKSIQDESELKYFQALERGRDNENALNDAYLKKKTGQVVLFGDTVQLYHVKSGKYLQVIPSKLAKDERENVRIALDPSGSAFSWIQICPRFKIDKEGDRILNNAEVLLKVAERSNEYVHSADREPEPGMSREINCSLETTSWKLNIYQSSTDTFNKSNLLASQLIYIHDPETKSYLSIALPPLEPFDSEEHQVLTTLTGEEDVVEEDPTSAYVHEHGDIVLVPPAKGLDSNFLWMLETNNFFSGGPIKWQTDQVRLKHVNTGLYLRQETLILYTADGMPIKKIIFTKTEDREQLGTLFTLVEINSQAKYLGNGKAVQIGHGGIWLDRGDVLDGSAATFTVCGNKDQGTALSLMINRFSRGTAQTDKNEVDARDMVDPSLRLPEPLDVFVGLSARHYLEKYFRMVVIPDDSEAVNTIWPSAGRTDTEIFKSIVDKLVIFIQGFPVSVTHIEAGVDKADLKVRAARQSLIREQGMLEIVLRYIHKLIPVFEILERHTKLSLDNSLLIRMAHHVQGLCFSIMYHTIYDNPENQMYVADFMPVLLANLNSQPLAVRCVTNMLSKNMELQETKIGTREIQIFVDKLKASKLNTMYLELLQACCSCEGNGVDGNQCKVTDMLFSNQEDEVIMGITADYAFTQQVNWNTQDSLYLNPSADSEAGIKGSMLIKMGLPRLIVHWVSSDGSNSHLGFIDELFDLTGFVAGDQKQGSVDFEESLHSTANSTKSMVASRAMRQQVANYLLAEMYLGAEMCMDRNYVAMHKLDDLFSYEVLVTIVKLNVSSSLKAAAVRLLMCLHVDRDPQAMSKIPCLTRTWSDIKKHEEPQLPYVDPSRRYMFGLIQEMVSEHVREMAGNQWDELSRHMLRMLRALVQFNFYGTNERMNNVIIPLIAALDRRNVVFTDLRSVGHLSRSASSKMIANNKAVLKLPPGISALKPEFVSDSLKKDEVSLLDGDEDSLLSSVRLYKSEKLSGFRRFKSLYMFLDSPLINVMIITYVVSALGFDAYQLIAGKSFQDFEANYVGMVELALIALFGIEIIIRGCCAILIGEFYFFITDVVNLVDISCISANIAIFFLSSYIDSGLAFVKAFRLIRISRFFRRSTDAKIMLTNGDEIVSEMSSSAARYSRAPTLELETMVEIVEILAFMQRMIEDRNLSLLLRNFYLWESGNDKRDPSALFQSAVEASQALTLNVQGFEDVMIDCIMFTHTPLVQSVLEVLMAHYSMKSSLLENARNAQILASQKREKQFRSVDQMLQQLEQNAETHELWGELETEADKIMNKQTKSILKELCDMCRVRRFVLEFDEDFMADAEIQDLYRNLGCFEICMKVLGLLDSVEEDEDGNLGEIALNTKELCLLCNNLLYWFFLGNSKNQELGYSELDFFLDTLDDDINSHLVVRAIFHTNESLMRQVPHTHLSNLVDKIIKNGKSHHYLSLFAAISHVGERNIVENQFEIVKSLTSPGRLQKVACFFVPVDHPEYADKRELMAPFLDSTQDLSLDDLPDLLAYHLMFLEVLSGCTVGRMNITTVEAKVQSVFNYVDILQSILDPGTITVCKIRLSKFFYNSIIEVELKIPGLEQSAYIWRLLESYISVLGYAKDELRTVEKLGWEAKEVSRQRIEYIMVSILITGGFFARYFDRNAFHFHEGGPINSSDKVHITQTQANELITSLFAKIKDVYDLDSPRLSVEMKDSIFDALVALNNSATKVIVDNLVPNTSLTQGANLKQPLTSEGKLLEKYEKFISSLSETEEVQKSIEKENLAFINILEELPRQADNVDADIRYEALIRKLISHIRDNITISETRKSMDPRMTKTSTWIVKAFRNMIENRMGMSIYERDDDGGQEQDEAAAPVVNALNSCGATALCLDLIADGIDEKLQLEAIRLGVGLLFKEGGALEVQTLMNEHLNKTNSELFFKQVRLTLQKLQAWHSWHQVIVLEEGEEPKPPEEILIVRFLQLMCEGHFLPNQDIMREQPHNHVSYNLLDDLVNYLNTLSRIPCRTSTVAAIRTSATILEVIQGPCEGNQVHFALNTELIETLNRINRAKMVNDCLEDEEVELKKTSIDILQGLLEGQGEKSVVYERVLSVVHLDIIHMMSKGIAITGDVIEDFSKEGQEMSDEKVILQTECVVLLQMLCNFKPSLYEELGISQNIEDIVGSGTAMIEVIWRGDIHRRFFHVPNICSFLAESSRDALVENVDRSNAENKLIDFLSRSHELYREVKHQQYLTEMGLSGVFSRANQNRATWITFFLALLINVLFVIFYDASNGDPAINNAAALAIINVLNIIQSTVAAFVVILSLVVRSPVIYQSLEAEGHTQAYTILYTALDPMTLYYFMYLILSVLGLMYDLVLPFLLLDIVAKNATTRDILNAVVIPRKQLMMTVVLGVFVTYIYSYFIFLNFRDNLGGIYGVGVFPGDDDCRTLWGCFKFVLCYGLRQGGGIGDVMNLSIGVQWVSDLSYFLIMSVMLLNIIFGIIIDTFGGLRADKDERLVDTEEICFICGIDKQTFDRASDEPDGFKTHIKIDHNMWNYLYYIFMLWEQDRDDDDGLELYVRKAIEADEIIWFPLNKAIRLEQAATEEEEMLKKMIEEIQQFEDAITNKIGSFQTEMGVHLDQITQATKQTFRTGETKKGIAKFLREFTAKEAVQEESNTETLDLVRAGTPLNGELDTVTEEAFGEEEIDEEEEEEEVTSTPRLVEYDDGFVQNRPFASSTSNYNNELMSSPTNDEPQTNDLIGFTASHDDHHVVDNEPTTAKHAPFILPEDAQDTNSATVLPFNGLPEQPQAVMESVDTDNQLIDIESLPSSSPPKEQLDRTFPDQPEDIV